MPVQRITALIEAELAQLSDPRVLAHIRSLLVPPAVHEREWDYTPDTLYPCWTVLAHIPSDTGIVYSEQGFGPGCPWGLVFLERNNAIGMDSGWFTNFLEAYFESQAASELPIWRVMESGEGQGIALTEEASWETTWSEVMRLRAEHEGREFSCVQTLWRPPAEEVR